MTEDRKLHNPWLVAVWPGMGSVALTGGYYLMSKLGMHVILEYPPRELFDAEHVEVEQGIIRTGRRPRSRFFAWNDPRQRRDLIVFIGEAQPPLGKYAFCEKLIDYALELGVERVFTFAAMATQMHPEHESRCFGAATDIETLQNLKQLELVILQDGHIGGLNGLLLGAAAEKKLPGACLLGEMPHIFQQLPFPQASMSVLEAFTTMAGVTLDFGELEQQAKAMQQKLGELLARVEGAMKRPRPTEAEGFSPEPADEGRIGREDRERIETLFAQAEQDRSKAYELKRVLDQLEVFKDYEDRFLDLFRNPES